MGRHVGGAVRNRFWATIMVSRNQISVVALVRHMIFFQGEIAACRPDSDSSLWRKIAKVVREEGTTSASIACRPRRTASAESNNGCDVKAILNLRGA